MSSPSRALLASRPALAAAGLGAVHALVDAATVTSVWRCGPSWILPALTSFWVVLGYDVLAFALQLPLGIVADRLGRARAAALAGVGLATLALLLVPYSSVGTLLAAGIGNALFHLGAGARALQLGGARAAPAGLFVAPGALGLGLGTFMGKTGTGPLWPLVALLVLAVVLVDALFEAPRESQPAPAPTAASAGAARVAFALLLISVAIRSFVGFGACRECPRDLLLTVGVPLAAFGGKALGGVAADRLGWLRTTVVALLASAPLIALNAGSTPVALAGLLLFQMTMPVTLVAVFQLMPDRPATAFGWPCLALIAGALPTFFPAGKALFGPGLLAGLIVLSASALFVALRLLGWSVRPGLGDAPSSGAVEPGGPTLAH